MPSTGEGRKGQSQPLEHRNGISGTDGDATVGRRIREMRGSDMTQAKFRRTRLAAARTIVWKVARVETGAEILLGAGTLLNIGPFFFSPRLLAEYLPFATFRRPEVLRGGFRPSCPAPRFAIHPSSAPSWGVRLRPRLVHDGDSVTLHDAILGHSGEASHVSSDFEKLKEGGPRTH